MLCGSPLVTAQQRMFSTSHIARLPMKRLCSTTASMRAMSAASPFLKIVSFLLRRTVHSSPQPSAVTPAASPAVVPSMSKGKTLFVPVETGIKGTSRHPFATIRFVPSPPSVTMQPHPAVQRSSAARCESICVPVSGISSIFTSRRRGRSERTPSAALRTIP